MSAISDQLTLEGVPFTDVTLGTAGRPTINAAFLASGTEDSRAAMGAFFTKETPDWQNR